MLFSETLKIFDTNGDTFFGVLAIITTTVIFYAFIYSRIAQKIEDNCYKAKQICIEEMNRRCMEVKWGDDEEDDEDEE